MNEGILLNIVSSESRLSYNATDKARKDVENTLTKNGYKVINVPYAINVGKYKAILNHLCDIRKCLSEIRREKPKDIFIQYPGFRIGTRSINLLTKLLKKWHITILIHDIDSLRVYGKISNREISILRRADKVIVHTENMRNYLLQNGVDTPMKVMWLFDYYAKGSLTINKPEDNYSIVFAGNLSKSDFLKKIENTIQPHILYLYGLPIDYKWPQGICYEGKFSPDEISDIKGDWGLVWDGESTQVCSGKMGNYLKYNSSHKASLYIASGKPVIVWSQSGIASFIEENHLGLCIDSLSDIPALLDTITRDDYNLYLKNVKYMQNILRSGKNLEDLIIS